MDPVLLAGTFTVVGSILGGLLSKYGIPLTRPNRVHKYRGTAKDVNLAQIRSELEDTSLFDYEISDCIIKNSGKEMSINCHVSASRNGQKSTWSLSGKGPLTNGVAYFIYHTKPHTTGHGWQGVMALSFSTGGKVLGFWITENTIHRGRMAFGFLEMEPA